MNDHVAKAPGAGWSSFTGGAHVNWDTVMGALLPVGLAALLVAGALLGSRMTPALRRRLERFVSYPLLMGLLAGETAWSLWTHDSLRTLLFGCPMVLYGALRKPLHDQPSIGDGGSRERLTRQLTLDRRDERPAFERRVG